MLMTPSRCTPVLAAILLLSCANPAESQNLQLPALPFDYADLEPAIDSETMTIHHMGHHAKYLDTINTALSTLRANPETKHLAKMGLDKLLQNLDKVPAPLEKAVRNGGGGFVNHVLFWNCMAKNGTGLSADTALFRAIEQQFGSQDKFEALFKDAATKLFGSGWVWLVWEDNKLSVQTTANQDTPAMEKGKVPLLGLDLWEHAYYLKYRNKRPEYITAFWNIIDWEAVNARFVDAAKTVNAEL